MKLDSLILVRAVGIPPMQAVQQIHLHVSSISSRSCLKKKSYTCLPLVTNNGKVTKEKGRMPQIVTDLRKPCLVMRHEAALVCTVQTAIHEKKHARDAINQIRHVSEYPIMHHFVIPKQDESMSHMGITQIMS